MTNCITKRAAVSLLAVAAIVTPAAAGQYDNNDRRFVIHNVGDSTIDSVRASNIRERVWGPNLIGPSTLAAGYDRILEPAFDEGYCRFDVLVTFTSGAEQVLPDINLCVIAHLYASEWGISI